MRKIILTMLLCCLFSVSVSAAKIFPNCPTESDEDGEVQQIIGRGLFEFLKNPEQSKVTADELKDVIEFYFALDSCYTKGMRTNLHYIDILNKISNIGYIQVQPGNDCTLNTTTIQNGSWYEEFYCIDGLLHADCTDTNAECPQGTLCNATSGRCYGDELINGSVSPPSLDLPPGLISWWTFDDLEGDTVKDEAGNYNGTLHEGSSPAGSGEGPQQVTGVKGMALNFDGINDHIKVGAIDELTTYNFTIAAWVKGEGTIVDIGRGAPHAAYGIKKDHRVRAYAKYPLKNYNEKYSYAPEEWNFIVASFWGPIEWDQFNFNKYIALYHNRDSKPIRSHTALKHTSAKFLSIGLSWYHYYNDYFSGIIDEVMIFDRVLTESEKDSLYDAVADIPNNGVCGNKKDPSEFDCGPLVLLESCSEDPLDQQGMQYILQNDVTTATGNCFTVTADDIYLNLNSKTITAQAPSSNGINLQAQNATVRDGTLVLAGITIDSSSSKNTIEDLDIQMDGEEGIVVKGDDNFLRSNTIDGAEKAIHVVSSGGNFVETNTITDSTLGIYLHNASNNQLSSNNVRNSEDDGILLSKSLNNTLIANRVYDSIGEGIVLLDKSSFNQIRYSITQGNHYGIAIISSGNNTFTQNNAHRNRDSGFYSTSGHNNRFNADRANENEVNGWTIRLSNDNSFSGIQAYNNVNYGIRFNLHARNNITNSVACGNSAFDIHCKHGVLGESTSGNRADSAVGCTSLTVQSCS